MKKKMRTKMPKECNSHCCKEDDHEAEGEQYTKEETDVAIYLYDNLRNREGKVSGMVFGIFKGEDAYRCLAKSHYSTIEGSCRKNNSKYPALFNNRDDVLDYLTIMLQKGMFHKAQRVQKRQQEKRKKELADQTAEEIEKINEQKQKKKEEDINPFALPKKKMPKLEIIEEITDFTTDEPMTYYVWVFDRPPTLKTWLLGILLLLAMVFCCFFPIWPSFLRSIAYYSAMAMIGFICFIIVLGIFRWILYMVIYSATAGHCEFWLFPNLFADCGFFDSFKPILCTEWSEIKVKAD